MILCYFSKNNCYLQNKNRIFAWLKFIRIACIQLFGIKGLIILKNHSNLYLLILTNLF